MAFIVTKYLRSSICIFFIFSSKLSNCMLFKTFNKFLQLLKSFIITKFGITKIADIKFLKPFLQSFLRKPSSKVISKDLFQNYVIENFLESEFKIW